MGSPQWPRSVKVRQWQCKNFHLHNTYAEADVCGQDPTLENLEVVFTVRTFNALAKVGITTFSALAAMSEQQLMEIDNIGVKCVSEIKEELAKRGFALNALNTKRPQKSRRVRVG